MSELKTHAEIIAFINELEDKFPVNEWKADDIHLWPLFRITLFFQIFKSVHTESNISTLPIVPAGLRELNSSKKPQSKVVKTKPKTLKAFLRERIKKNTILARILSPLRARQAQPITVAERLLLPADIVCLSFTVNRALLSGKWYNRQIDPLLEYGIDNRLSCTLLELNNNTGYKLPRFHDQLCIGIEEELATYVSKASQQHTPQVSVKGLKECISYVKTKAGAVEFPQFEEANILATVKNLFGYVSFFREVYKRKKAKLSLLTCYYDMRCMAACIACHQLGIPVADIQHGVQGETHIAYGRWTKVPTEGYKMLPSLFWCWDKEDAQAIRQWSEHTKGVHQTVVGGNPWLSLWKNGETDLVKQYDKQINPIKLKQANAVHILYSMQPIADALPDFIVEAIAQSPANWKWWIRIHPRQQVNVEEYKSLLAHTCTPEQYTIEEATALPLPALLRHTQVHITNWSSVVLEAADFNVPSILIHTNGYDIFQQQIAAGIAVAASRKTNHVIESIQLQLKYGGKTPDEDTQVEITLQSLLTKPLQVS